jgi:hypothetical protein
MTKRSLRLLLALGLTAWFAGTACSRQHMSPHYAESYNAWFAAQHLPPRPPSEAAKRSIDNLDAQEAAMVSKTYRRNVGRGEEAQPRQIMMVAPRATGEAYMPPPSVPANQ